MFYKWLTAARTVRRRRVVLQEKEREMKQYLMASAWDKWRGAFKAEKLRSAVCSTGRYAYNHSPAADTYPSGAIVCASEPECVDVSGLRYVALQDQGMSFCGMPLETQVDDVELVFTSGPLPCHKHEGQVLADMARCNAPCSSGEESPRIR